MPKRLWTVTWSEGGRRTSAHVLAAYAGGAFVWLLRLKPLTVLDSIVVEPYRQRIG